MCLANRLLREGRARVPATPSPLSWLPTEGSSLETLPLLLPSAAELSCHRRHGMAFLLLCLLHPSVASGLGRHCPVTATTHLLPGTSRCLSRGYRLSSLLPPDWACLIKVSHCICASVRDLYQMLELKHRVQPSDLLKGTSPSLQLRLQLCPSPSIPLLSVGSFLSPAGTILTARVCPTETAPE